MQDAIQDPTGVINTLQARLDQLEDQLRRERECAQQNVATGIEAALRRLRLHAVIPLYVGGEDFETLRDDVARSSPELALAIQQVWMLSRAPVDQDVKTAIGAAAKNAMSRWS